ncbi:OprD family porin [Pseudomonas aeruginosa]|uniref:OprD family porin n=1 Tax=Pseudomonas aeruginosa TaxID=287 RepID=UPI002F91282E
MVIIVSNPALYRPLPIRLLSLCSFMLTTSAQAAGFLEDSRLQLDLRNFYMNRDYREANTSDVPRHNGQPQTKAEDWGQGFLLRVGSGFTETPVGLGLDALGLYGIKLDAGRGTSGTGVLVRNPTSGESESEFGFLGLTVKAKVSQTRLTLGTHEPLLPIVFRNDTRMLPQTFEGAQLVSKDVEKLSLTAGQFNKTRWRDSTNYTELNMSAAGAIGGVASNRFNYAGASGSFIGNVTGTYYYADLESNYHQHFVGLAHQLSLTETLSLKTDLRWFKSGAEGRTNIDNQYIGGMVTVGWLSHAVSFVYQDQRGKTGMPFVSGADAFTPNTISYQNFLRAQEDAWQLRYDYNFSPLGFPGMTFMGRHVQGAGFKVGNESAREWERDLELAYVIQSGFAKNLAVRWRNITYRGSRTVDVNENRLIFSYTYTFR